MARARQFSVSGQDSEYDIDRISGWRGSVNAHKSICTGITHEDSGTNCFRCTMTCFLKPKQLKHSTSKQAIKLMGSQHGIATPPKKSKTCRAVAKVKHFVTNGEADIRVRYLQGCVTRYGFSGARCIKY